MTIRHKRELVPGSLHLTIGQKSERGLVMDIEAIEEAIIASAPDKQAADTFQDMVKEGKIILMGF